MDKEKTIQTKFGPLTTEEKQALQWKTKRLLRTEIRDFLTTMDLSKDDLMALWVVLEKISKDEKPD